MDSNNKQLHMSYLSFKKDVYGHLASYNKWGPGKFNGKQTSYPHIADVAGKRPEDIVKEIIESDGVKTDMFRKPHRYAHHLNSSQVLCYEFFRPLIDENDKMAKALGTMGIPSDSFISFKAEFEKEFDDGEGTNFDFYMSSNKRNNLYVEVKYTEQGFASCKNDETHKLKFESTYKTLIRNSICIKPDQKEKIEFPQMRKYYQLFRNILRIQNDSDYVVFLYPERNSMTKAQFERFRNSYLSPEGCQRVKGVFWESLISVMSNEFREKFFFYV